MSSQVRPSTALPVGSPGALPFRKCLGWDPSSLSGREGCCLCDAFSRLLLRREVQDAAGPCPYILGCKKKEACYYVFCNLAKLLTSC